VTARLAVNVTGLPAQAAAQVTVSGPSGYTRALAGTAQLNLLAPGAYTVSASPVQLAGRTYTALPASLDVALAASVTPQTVTVEYGAGTAVLLVTVAGLPVGTDAAVTVSGPAGLSRVLTTSTALPRLEAGSYTVTATTVGSALTTHQPSLALQTVTLVQGDSSQVVVSYGSAPLQLEVQQVVSGLTQPVFLTAPEGDARLFIVERPGRVLLFANGALKSAPFLDIRSRVNNNGERGLLGMAFDPRYASNGIFYVYYVDLGGNMALERFTSTPGADVAGASGGVVMTIPHGGSEHHGGMIAFGPDSMLYLAPGDGGCCGDPQNNAQNLVNLLGKVLRIDVRTSPYSIPAGNPFIGLQPNRQEIWAYGLRNPWRFSFDAPGGMLYIGDVGQDAREEVDAIPVGTAGANFGWRFMEGIVCYNPTSNCALGRTLTRPVYDYTHADGCSVTGGYVYRGREIPEFVGHFLFSDYCRGWLRSFRVQGAGVADLRAWAGITLPQMVSFGRDGAGELYMVASNRVWKLFRKIS
ncbi:MAG: PQQ-dependent sugar dehydrogenase, partial [Gemmatimonadaceae bacterium]